MSPDETARTEMGATMPRSMTPGKLMPCEDTYFRMSTIISSILWRVILRRANGKAGMQRNGKADVWPICATVRRK